MKARTITISRQYGSGGHEVAKKLSEALGLPCYDNEVISLAAKESGAQLWEFQMAENLRDTNFIYNLSPTATFRRNRTASSSSAPSRRPWPS